MSTPVLRALAGKPGAAKRALLEQYGDTGLEASADGQCCLCLCGSLCRLALADASVHTGATQQSALLVCMVLRSQSSIACHML